MTKRIINQSQIIGISIVLIAAAISFFLIYRDFGFSPGSKVIQAVILGILIIPNAAYFFSQVSNSKFRVSILILTIVLCSIPTGIDGRLRLTLVLIILTVANASIYLSKKRGLNGERA